MPNNSGTPDSANERRSQYQGQDVIVIQTANNGQTRGDNTPPSRQTNNSLIGTIENQVVGSVVQQGIKSLLSQLVGGASQAAGGASVVEETIGAVGSVAEVGAVLL